MIQDKIYIVPTIAERSVSKKTDNAVEYIRKDALLEWAKKRLSSCAVACGKIVGGSISYTELIEKIESL